MLFDTHVHLNADQFEDDLEQVLKRANEAGVEQMVVVGFDEKTIKKAIELVETYDFCMQTSSAGIQLMPLI